jgi:hypothetical protein
VLALIAIGLCAAVVLGADPTSAPVEVVSGGDLRSAGEGPGLVGSPLFILLAVVALGVATATVTLLIVRLTRRA